MYLAYMESESWVGCPEAGMNKNQFVVLSLVVFCYALFPEEMRLSSHDMYISTSGRFRGLQESQPNVSLGLGHGTT